MDSTLVLIKTSTPFLQAKGEVDCLVVEVHITGGKGGKLIVWWLKCIELQAKGEIGCLVVAMHWTAGKGKTGCLVVTMH